MDKFIDLATGCANGLQMLALGRHCCCVIDCSGDALWYAAQMHGFCTRSCGMLMSLQHLCCNCGSIVLRNADATFVHSVSNSAVIVFCDCIADDAAIVHHSACSLRCKVIATRVAMLPSSAASAKQYGRRSFALLILRDADVRYTDVCRNLRSNGGCVSHDARTAVGGEILKRARTCYSEYLQCADATVSGSCDSSFGIAHTLDSKCADVLSFPNFKPAASRRLMSHAESTESAEWILWNTNHANITNGNVGSRLGATEWTGSLLRFFLTSRNGECNSPEDAYICPNSASSTAGRIMPRIPHRPSENCPKIACWMWREIVKIASDWSQY